MSAQPAIQKPIKAADALPPHAPQSEVSILANLLQGFPIDGALLEQLEPADFFIVQWGWIFEAMLELYDQDQAIDLITVEERLEQRGQLAQLTYQEASGGLVLSKLARNFAASGQVRSYAKRIKETAVRRRMLTQATELAKMAYDESTDVTIQLDRHDRAMSQLKPFNPNAAFVYGDDSPGQHLGALRQQATQHAWHAVPWAALADRAPVTMDGDLIVVAGPEGSGKSALLMNWAEEEARAGVKTAYIHTEMNKKQVFDRRLAANCKTIPFAGLQKPETLTAAQWQAIEQAGIQMEAWLPRLDYWHAEQVEEAKLFTVMQRMADDFGTRLFVLDYLNDVIPDVRKADNGAAAWRNLLARMEAFNNRHNTRILTAAQLNNEGNAYMIGKALRQKAALFLKIKPEALEHDFDFEYDGIAYRYVAGDYKPIMTVAIEKYRAGGRGVAKLLYVGPRYLWVDVPRDFDDGRNDPGAYQDRREPRELDF